MDKYLRKYKKEFNLTHSRKKALLKWKKKLDNGELKDEVANYGNFSRIILESLLGYDYDEDVEENKGTDYGHGRSEFILYKDKQKFMVIELKGSNYTDLDKAQSHRKDKLSPVEQGFKYVQDSKESLKWILISNYDEFRLYNYEKRSYPYISFKIEELLEPETFKQFMLVFSRFSTIENNLIERLISKTVFVERDFENEFYKLYHETRLMLIAELEHIYPELPRDKSVHYAQLILNRYIFICFAEDLGLLPEEISVKTIGNPVKTGDFGHSEIWHRLNSLFIDVDEGNDFKKIYGYNGGLFKEDLESLKIRDVIDDHSIFKDAYQKWKFEEYSLIVEQKLSPHGGKINPIYKNLMTISSFDFSSEVDVNILGHIFENSIGVIEDLKEDTRDRRKKEGIFYTQEYITDYICRNTIIPYLSKSGKANTVEKLIGEYWGSEINLLDEKVEKIKIVDPACGSGAFLNKATDILLEIHESIFNQKYTGESTLDRFFDSIKERRKILLNNIYGVDLNEESVEITKLSLFLKVCRKGLKLPNLDENIKLGNSLIDDPKYTDKSFKWGEKFPEIFKEGGFDIVIGNPPYVRQERIKEIKPYLKENYEVYDGVADLFVYFFEKGLNILKDGGMFSFICSDRFVMTKYGKKLRKLILKNEFKEYIYHSENAFENATVLTCTVIIRKKNPSDNHNILINYQYEMPQNMLDDGFWSFENPKSLNLRDKIEKISLKLKEIPDLRIYRGITTGLMKAFVIDENTKNELILENEDNNDLLKPFIRGIDIQRWSVDYKNLYFILTKIGTPITKYPAIKKHLEKYEEQLKVRQDQGNYWWELRACDYYNEFEKEKIIWADMSVKPRFTIDKKNLFFETSVFFMTKPKDYDLRYLVSLLNSNLLLWLFLQISPKLYGKRLRFKKLYVEQLPIYPATLDQQVPFIEKGDKMLHFNKDLLYEINGFKDWLKGTYKIKKFSKKLDKYYELSFDEFLNELKKKKVDIKPRKTQELLKKEFNDSLNKINPLLQKIKEIDMEINEMVCDLYGLTSEERGIIEESLKYH